VHVVSTLTRVWKQWRCQRGVHLFSRSFVRGPRKIPKNRSLHVWERFPPTLYSYGESYRYADRDGISKKKKSIKTRAWFFIQKCIFHIVFASTEGHPSIQRKKHYPSTKPIDYWYQTRYKHKPWCQRSQITTYRFIKLYKKKKKNYDNIII